MRLRNAIAARPRPGHCLNRFGEFLRGRQQMSKKEEEFFADLWMRQSDILLKATSFMPVVELAVLAAWYGLVKDRQILMARFVAIAGAAVMVLASIYMGRTVQYVSFFRKKMGSLMKAAPKGWFGLGRYACLAVPVFCIP
jgi:hypothetical protein